MKILAIVSLLVVVGVARALLDSRTELSLQLDSAYNNQDTIVLGDTAIFVMDPSSGSGPNSTLIEVDIPTMTIISQQILNLCWSSRLFDLGDLGIFHSCYSVLKDTTTLYRLNSDYSEEGVAGLLVANAEVYPTNADLKNQSISFVSRAAPACIYVADLVHWQVSPPYFLPTSESVSILSVATYPSRDYFVYQDRDLSSTWRYSLSTMQPEQRTNSFPSNIMPITADFCVLSGSISSGLSSLMVQDLMQWQQNPLLTMHRSFVPFRWGFAPPNQLFFVSQDPSNIYTLMQMKVDAKYQSIQPLDEITLNGVGSYLGVSSSSSGYVCTAASSVVGGKTPITFQCVKFSLDA